MGTKSDLLLTDYIERSKDIIDRARTMLEKVGYAAVNDLPEDIYDGNDSDKRRISIVFAGQYSAGKSTIIKAMTGREDIATGVGITTQKTHEYSWNEITIVDTPGLKTGLRPEHDEIASNAIANADILAYVVTEELFGNIIGNDFRAMLFEKDKAKEMILIVNKMSDVGQDTEEYRKNMLKGLERVASSPLKSYMPKTEGPYGENDLRCVFIDAEWYLDSIKIKDEKKAKRREKLSNYSGLKKALDDITKNRGILAQLTTPLYRTENVLQSAIQAQQVSSGNETIDELEKAKLEEQKIFVKCQGEMESRIRPMISEMGGDVRKVGRNFVRSISKYKNEDEFKNAYEGQYDKIKEIVSDYENKINSEAEKIYEKYLKKLNDFTNSDSHKKLVKNITIDIAGMGDKSIENLNKDGNEYIKKLLKQKTIESGSAYIAGQTIGREGVKTLSRHTGSAVAEGYTKVTHFLGGKLKPWQATKFASKVGTAAKVASKLATLVPFVIAWLDYRAKKKQEDELRNLKDGIRADFNEQADQCEKLATKDLEEYIQKNCFDRISEIDLLMEEIDKKKAEKNETCRKLLVMKNECTKLIADIHMNCD